MCRAVEDLNRKAALEKTKKYIIHVMEREKVDAEGAMEILGVEEEDKADLRMMVQP